MIVLKHFCQIKNNRLLYALFFALLFFSACNSKKHNRLSNASSPYLQQHANNPVDWYEWGDEALAAAKKQNKPLLISIGYASCHWCHQMAKESFMDTAVARLMNENFICIKVDREERPDIDNIYQNACQLISGSSGWPLNAFALPDGKPFFAGTYYSQQSWMSLLKQMAAAYTTQNKKVMLQAQSLSAGIAKLEFSVLTDSGANGIDKKMYQHLFEKIYAKMDLVSGGLKGAQKFPAPSTVEFLLQYYFLTKDKRALDIATTTLTNMALGGICDQVGGGFARYATDSLWRIPHFEKMLYDNAQLISVYAHAYQLTGNLFFKKIVEQTCGFVHRELNNAGGGYNSSVNADTDEEEGKFYTWTPDEIKSVLPADYKLISGYYNVSSTGNWKNGRNVLYASQSPVEFAAAQKINSGEFETQLDAANAALLETRNKRIKPTVDNKVLTSWNALLIQGFLDAFAAIGDEQYLQYAVSIAGFVENRMFDNNGRLWRSLKKKDQAINGFLDDYAFLARSYIRLYQLTFNKQWLIRSQQLVEYLLQNFYDKASAMFFYTEARADNNVINKIQIADNEIPASNAIMADVLYKLGIYLDIDAYKEKAGKMLYRMTNQLNSGETNYFSSWCLLAGLFCYGTNEVAIMGPEATSINLALQKKYLPAAVFMGAAGEENLPVLQGKKSGDKTLIYVCTNGTCKRPVDNIAAAIQQLSAK